MWVQYQPESNRRKWLRKHGKGAYIDFEDDELVKLRECFKSLDDDGSESIGVDELEDPLIALGLVESRQQVQQIVQLVDEDGSEMIEFDEFLQIIKGGAGQTKATTGSSGGDNGSGAIYKFFKNLTTGKLQSDDEQELPFSLFISSKRRRKLLDSMMSTDVKERAQGEVILHNYKK